MEKLLLVLSLLVAALRPCRAQVAGPEALGDSCMGVNDTYHALAYYAEAASAGGSPGLRRKVADCHYRRGEWRKCVEAMLPASGYYGDSLGLRLMREMFVCYGRLGDTGEQVAWGRAILRRYPLDGQTVAELAGIFNNDSTYMPSNALQLAGGYLDVDSTCIPVLRQYADAHFLMKNFSRAAESYRKLLALGDSTFNTLYSLGMCCMKDSAYAEAKRWLTAAAAESGFGNSGCLYRLGAVCVEMDEPKLGLAFLQMADRLNRPDPSDVYAVKTAEGEAYCKMGDYVAAAAVWLEALDANPLSLATTFNVAQAYASAGKRDLAEEYCRKFLALAADAPDSDTLRQWVRQAEAMLGGKRP